MVTGNPGGSTPGRPIPGASQSAGRVSRVMLGAGLVLASAVGLYLAFFRGTTGPVPAGAPPDPRLDYAGPFRNVHPAVRYVSDKRCADCHPKIALAYAKHPMGRSFLPMARAAAPPEDARFNNPFQALGSEFLIDHQGSQVRHRRTRLDPDGRPAAAFEWQVHYVIGSGKRGHSYLTNLDGYLFQTPVSWFGQKKRKIWDLSPGFGPAKLTGRPVLPDCLFCHANRANYVEGSVNRYAQPVFQGHAIGCQRCHGPGELHVASRQRLEPVSSKGDYTIVNPSRLEPALREAVCQQCHLIGEARVRRHGRGLNDFRPGLPLESFWSVFVPAPETGQGPKAVHHVEQMYQSRCFQGGHGSKQLGCISCHDPHERVAPEKRVVHYRKACLNCHRTHGCSEPLARRLRVNKADSCITCHMKPYASSDIAHTASTDHRILRHAQPKSRPDARRASGDGFPVVSFYGDQKAGGDEEDERDRAVALVNLALAGKPSAFDPLPRALARLESALRRDPDDWVAGEAKGLGLGLRGRWTDGLAAFQAVLAKAGDREPALVGAAAMAEASGNAEAAQGYWRRAIAANPWLPDYRRRLVLLLVKNKVWDKAQPECQAWLRLDPFSAEARSMRIMCLLAAGNKTEARAEFARIEALAPENLGELKIRFGEKLK